MFGTAAESIFNFVIVIDGTTRIGRVAVKQESTGAYRTVNRTVIKYGTTLLGRVGLKFGIIGNLQGNSTGACVINSATLCRATG